MYFILKKKVLYLPTYYNRPTGNTIRLENSAYNITNKLHDILNKNTSAIYCILVIRAIGHYDREMKHGNVIKNESIKTCKAISTLPYELCDAYSRLYATQTF